LPAFFQGQGKKVALLVGKRFFWNFQNQKTIIAPQYDVEHGLVLFLNLGEILVHTVRYVLGAKKGGCNQTHQNV
jgi:hypothetical protein